VSTGFTAEEFGPDPKADGGNVKPEGVDAKSGSPGKSNGASAQHKADDANPRPLLGPHAFHGLAGEVVKKIAPQTEADPAALLLQLLVYGGNSIGRGPYFQIGKDRHYTNLFGLLVGDTAKARKGLSAGHVRDFYMKIDPEWVERRIKTGMSSGEGIVHNVRDAVLAMRKGEMKVIDPGIADKRLLIDEREFQSALTVMQRQGNTLSTVIRDAWDCRPVLETLTKKEPCKATKPFIAIVGHITIDELQESLDRTAMANGYANRFLMAYIQRSKELPLGGDDVDLTELVERTRHAIDAARAVERVTFNNSAKQLWCEIYRDLSAGQPGLLGAITARSEPQTLRLALIYALLDGEREIDHGHIQAALAMWTFCATSSRFIFGDLLGNTTADAILRALRKVAPNGQTRTEINALFEHNRSSGDIARALELLLTAGKARCTITKGRGRPIETWFAV